MRRTKNNYNNNPELSIRAHVTLITRVIPTHLNLYQLHKHTRVQLQMILNIFFLFFFLSVFTIVFLKIIFFIYLYLVYITYLLYIFISYIMSPYVCVCVKKNL